MPTSSFNANVGARPEGLLPGRVALVVDALDRSQLGAILDVPRLTFQVFDSADTPFSRAHIEGISVVVLWVDDTASGLSSRVSTLAGQLDGVPLILACPHIERWTLRAALSAGIAGLVLWDDLTTALIPCIHAVLAGQICVSRIHAQHIEPPVLSSREKQILGLVVMGYSNAQIATQLFLAESTVKSHLSSAFGKLGVRSRNEAVSLIIDPERGLGMGILALSGDSLVPPGPPR